MNARLALVLALIVLAPLRPVHAQLAAPNAAGVSMGHLHYVVRDVEANRKFWIDFGATPVKLGDREILRLIMVYSWNEHFERTAIEPTDAWGDRYLQWTACYIRRAHQGTAGAC